MTEESQKIDLDASGTKPSVNESDYSSKLADKGNVLDDGKLQTDVEVEERSKNNTHLEKKSLDSKELTEKSATSSISSSKLFKSSEKKSIDSKEIIEKSAKLSISSSKLFKSSEKKSLGSKEIIEESATSSISSSKLFKSSEKKSINSKEVTEKTAKLSISSSKLFKSSEKKSLGSKEIIEEPVTSSISSSKPFKSSEKNWLNSKEVTEETAKSSISSSKLLKSSMDVPSPDPKLSEEYGFDPTKSISLTFMDPPAYEFVKRGLLEEKDDDISGLFDNLDDQDAEQEEESLTEEEYHYEEKKRPRTSILSYTLKYDFDRRYDDSLDEHRFKEALTMEMKIPSLGMEMWEEEEEEEKEKVVEESLISEESESSLPRSVHVERYHLIAKQLNQSKVINLVLERKLALYFRRKKMPYVFIPEDLPDLAIKRYKRVLDNLDYLSTNATRQRENIINELSRLKHTKREKTIHLDQMFSDLQAREKEVAHGLINTKNGTEMTDEYVEHQLHRQQKNMEEKYKLMVKWIRLTKMVNEKEQAIKAVDKVDEGHYLTNFDKLKSENRLRADKIEEQERELMKYRKKSEETVQILAHIREKISALRSDIQDAIEEDAFLQRNRDVARSSLNDTKIERDRYKRLTKNLEEESGLLSHPHLVQDMKESEKEFEEKKRLLKDLRDGYRLSMKQTKNIRKLLEKREELLAARGSRLITKSSKRKFALHNASFYRQPGFFKPTLPSTILRDVLTDFQINVTKIEYPADSSVKSTKLHPYKGVKYYSAKNRYITSKGVKN